jgi:glycosyltransferase A (GT-A) superfamily protein (DUF2064 family)
MHSRRVFSRGSRKSGPDRNGRSEITGDTVSTAFRLLEETDVVLGPAKDGGYYLIGLKNYEPILFEDIDWGTNTVFNRTLNHIIENNLSHKFLDTLKDVDRVEDVDPGMLTRLRAEE